MALPHLGNVYLSQSVFTLLSEMLSLPPEDGVFHDSYPSVVLEVALSTPPFKSDTILLPAWINFLGILLLRHRSSDTDKYSKDLGKVWKVVWGYLDSADSRIRKTAAESLCKLCQSFSPAFIADSLQDRDSKSALRKIVARLMNALDSLAYAHSIPELLSVVTSLIANLRYRPTATSPTAAQSLLTPLIARIGDLRSQKTFEYIEDTNRALAAAMRILGPEVLLQILPLNIEPSDRQAGREPRAYLLSLLPHPHPSPLQHFVSYFVPLSERMFDLQSAAEAGGRQSEAKVWNVLVVQVWAGLVGYCWGTRDLKKALSPTFSQLLSQLLYGQPQLRPAIFKALKSIVESNLALAYPKVDVEHAGDVHSESICVAEATQNLEFLRGQAENWLAILFNIFGTAGPDTRSTVGEVIDVWASISGESVISKMYEKIMELFKTNITTPSKTTTQVGSESGQANVAVVSQELLVILLPYLDSARASLLFEWCMAPEVLGASDHGIQKRGYKTLTRLVESGSISIDVPIIIQKLDAFSEGLAPSAKKNRFDLLSSLIPLIPSCSMHVIPTLISEAALGTKESSAKARNAAFDLIVTMARKMNEGGLVKRNLIDGMEEDGGTETKASLEEFLTMLSGGLSASPHMISATITAISRVLFEFKETVTPEMQSEIFTTLLGFLSSANREIVKSVLGYVKLAIHTLPAEIIKPHLSDLVTALLSWSHDHKNHFKIKVRHIFERMLRRFEWDEVYSCAGEGEAAKLLINIKKRKERAKRKKTTKEESGGEDEVKLRVTTGSAFEDIVYGSESEEDGDEDERHPKKESRERNVRLRMDDDDPMDLLEGVASRITNPAGRRPGPSRQDQSHFRTDEETGKMIIDEDEMAQGESDPPTNMTGSAYLENLKSADGFTRGPDGKVKFHKNTKKRQRDDGELEGAEALQERNQPSVTKVKRKLEPKFGHEFKAKKAGGDVKKKGVEPYAYMPLSQAAKKGKSSRHMKLGIIGKR